MTNQDSNTATVPTMSPLFASLHELERAVETPIVSGELDRWLSTASKALGVVRETFRHEADTTHAGLYQEIEENDTELLSRVADMRGKESELAQQLATLAGSFGELVKRVSDPPGGETSVDMLVPDLTKDTIAVIVAIRTLVTGIETWHSEALLRDRGVGD